LFCKGKKKDKATSATYRHSQKGGTIGVTMSPEEKARKKEGYKSFKRSHRVESRRKIK